MYSVNVENNEVGEEGMSYIVVDGVRVREFVVFVEVGVL